MPEFLAKIEHIWEAIFWTLRLGFKHPSSSVNHRDSVIHYPIIHIAIKTNNTKLGCTTLFDISIYWAYWNYKKHRRCQQPLNDTKPTGNHYNTFRTSSEERLLRVRSGSFQPTKSRSTPASSKLHSTLLHQTLSDQLMNYAAKMLQPPQIVVMSICLLVFFGFFLRISAVLFWLWYFQKNRADLGCVEGDLVNPQATNPPNESDSVVNWRIHQSGTGWGCELLLFWVEAFFHVLIFEGSEHHHTPRLLSAVDLLKMFYLLVRTSVSVFLSFLV